MSKTSERKRIRAEQKAMEEKPFILLNSSGYDLPDKHDEQNAKSNKTIAHATTIMVLFTFFSVITSLLQWNAMDKANDVYYRPYIGFEEDVVFGWGVDSTKDPHKYVMMEISQYLDNSGSIPATIVSITWNFVIDGIPFVPDSTFGNQPFIIMPHSHGGIKHQLIHDKIQKIYDLKVPMKASIRVKYQDASNEHYETFYEYEYAGHKDGFVVIGSHMN